MAFFFLISGYGLMTSYINKGDAYLESFFSKRMVKLLLPFLLCLLTWIVYNEVTYWDTFYFVDYFKNKNFGDWLPNTWFVWVIFCAYLLFYLIFKQKFKTLGKLSIFCMFSIVYYIICANERIPEYWYRSSYAIALGMAWRYYEKEIISLLNTKILSCLIPTIAFISFVACFPLELKVFKPLFACIIFIWSVYNIPNKLDSKLISFLALISYEVYLLQQIPMDFVCNYLNITSTIIAVPFIFALDVIMAYIIYILYSKIQKLRPFTRQS